MACHHPVPLILGGGGLIEVSTAKGWVEALVDLPPTGGGGPGPAVNQPSGGGGLWGGGYCRVCLGGLAQRHGVGLYRVGWGGGALHLEHSLEVKQGVE